MVERRMRYNRSDCASCNSQNGGNCNMQSGGANIGNLIKKLRKIDFAIVDTVLYLDAYPHCKAALEYYKKLVAEREELSKKLSELGNPMSCMANLGDGWDWIKSPWPWEYEANV